MCIFYRSLFVLFLLAIVLPVLLRYTAEVPVVRALAILFCVCNVIFQYTNPLLTRNRLGYCAFTGIVLLKLRLNFSVLSLTSFLTPLQ